MIFDGILWYLMVFDDIWWYLIILGHCFSLSVFSSHSLMCPKMLFLCLFQLTYPTSCHTARGWACHTGTPSWRLPVHYLGICGLALLTDWFLPSGNHGSMAFRDPLGRWTQPESFNWGFPRPWGYPNSWMVYHGKSPSRHGWWFGGTEMDWKPHIDISF